MQQQLSQLNFHRAAGIALFGLFFLALETVLRVGPIGRAGATWVGRLNPRLTGVEARGAWYGLTTRIIANIHHAVVLPLVIVTLLPPALGGPMFSPGGWPDVASPAPDALNPFWTRPFTATSPFVRSITLVTCGQFLWDLWCAVRDAPREGTLYILHGLMALGLYSGACLNDGWHTWAAGYLLWELSTPWVHLRWAMGKRCLGSAEWPSTRRLARLRAARRDGVAVEKAKPTDADHEHPLYVASGKVAFALFFVARIAWGLCLSARFWLDTHNRLSARAAAAAAAGVAPSLARSLGLSTLPSSAAKALFDDPGPPLFVWFSRLANVSLNGLNLLWFSKMILIAAAAASGTTPRDDGWGAGAGSEKKRR